jgi:hypothetical protein
LLISVNPPILSVRTSGSGKATHLGKYSFGMEHEVNLVNQAATGSIEFTAANGDRLYATFTGQGFSTPIPGVLATVETATITGGTGRFEDATGEFTVVWLVFGDMSTTSGLFGGTISAAGATGGAQR